MGIAQRLAAWLAPTETRASTGFYGSSFYGGTVAGQAVNVQTAENVSAVLSCVNAISSALASLPVYVYESRDGGRVEAPNHPVSRLIRRPNNRQTWPDFLEFFVSQTLLHGNGLAEIVTDGAGQPVALQPIPWPCVTVMVLPSGRLVYDVTQTYGPYGTAGQVRRLLDDAVLHLRDRSDDSYLGRSRLSRAPAVVAAALSAQTYAASMWDNQAVPSGVLKVPTGIKPEGLKRLRAMFEENFTGASNARRVLIADGGSEWQSISASAEDSELLSSRKFTVAECCRLFQVPPPLVQDYSFSTFTNAAQADLWFARTSLQPWARKIEAAFSASLFTDPRFAIEIDFASMTRGDYAARWAADTAAVQAGIILPNEIRAENGYPPLPPAAPAPAPATLPIA